MVYVGSKARYADAILEIVLKDRKPGQLYVEPFMGGGNVICKVTGPRWGNDNNKYLIALFKAVIEGWKPPHTISRSDHRYFRENKDVDLVITGYIGFICSFRGKFFGGYTDKDLLYYGIDRGKFNTSKDHWAHLKKQCASLAGVKITNQDYTTLDFTGAKVYCDPPYAGTTNYGSFFDYKLFWSWVRNISRYNQVFISEYNAPHDFKCVWKQDVKSNLGSTSLIRTEKLFTLR